MSTPGTNWSQDRVDAPGWLAPARDPSLDLLARLRGSGIAAVVSGSGPSLLAFTDSASERAVAAAAPPGWTARTLSVDRAGATVAEQGTTPPRASAD